MGKKGFTEDERFKKGMSLIHDFAEKHGIPYILIFREDDAFVSWAYITEDAPERMAFANAFIQASADDPDKGAELGMAVMAVNADQEELRKRIENTDVNPDMDEMLKGMMKPRDKEFAIMVNSLLYLASEEDVPFAGGMYIEKEMVAFTDGIDPDDGLEMFFCPFILAGDVMIPEGMFE